MRCKNCRHEIADTPKHIPSNPKERIWLHVKITQIDIQVKKYLGIPSITLKKECDCGCTGPEPETKQSQEDRGIPMSQCKHCGHEMEFHYMLNEKIPCADISRCFCTNPEPEIIVPKSINKTTT